MNILLASWQNESFGMAALSFINALKRQKCKHIFKKLDFIKMFI